VNVSPLTSIKGLIPKNSDVRAPVALSRAPGCDSVPVRNTVQWQARSRKRIWADSPDNQSEWSYLSLGRKADSRLTQASWAERRPWLPKFAPSLERAHHSHLEAAAARFR